MSGDHLTDHGGPAFPVTLTSVGGRIEMRGMTLRDYFAGQALVSILANDAWSKDNADPAHVAYMVADLMLREKART